MAASRACQPFIILALISGCIGVDPCIDYDLMWMEYGRRSSDFYSKNTAISICDAYLKNDTWYRFEHDAGNRLVEGPVGPWHCGTEGPIWMNGTHPTDTTEVTAEVCATYSSTNVCGWNGTVRIQLCSESGSEYFVYLPAIPPGCALAYCVDAESRKQCVPPDVWLPNEFKCGEYIAPDPCIDYDLAWMEYGRRSSDFNSKDTGTSICDAFLKSDTWYRFEHDAGNRLVEGPVGPWHCGTEGPIWMNGTHPTDTTEVTAEVCATYSSTNACGWNGTVRIQLCNESGSEYFVYLLAVPPGCPLAYCVDAASRKQCVPPLIWLPDEFKCGEHITTSTSTSGSSSPCSGWETWGPWSDCTKECDHGLQKRYRTCCKLPCHGDGIDLRPCAELNCEELPEEKDRGVVLSLQTDDVTQDTMFTVVANQQNIDTILRTSINSICSQNASLCCGVEIEYVNSSLTHYVTYNDIYAAKGFPKSKSDGTVHYKVIANVNEAVNQAICSSDSTRRTARQVQPTNPNFISFTVMEMAVRNSASQIFQVTGLAVKDYWAPVAYPDDNKDERLCPVATCIVPIVVCCTVVPIIAIIVGCIILHKMKASKKTPKSATGKDKTIVASNMVYPLVTAEQTKQESLPRKSLHKHR